MTLLTFGERSHRATLGSGAGWVIYLYLTRFIAGMGIGGEYAAINSAIDEMIPAHYRGRVDIGVNGTYWAGAILGTLGALLLLQLLPPSLGWRLGFLIGFLPLSSCSSAQPARKPPGCCCTAGRPSLTGRLRPSRNFAGRPATLAPLNALGNTTIRARTGYLTLLM